MALSRRDFVKLCSGTVAGFGVSQMFHPAIHEAFAQTLTGERPPVFWVQGQGCTGCSVTLLNSTHPSIADVLLKIISLEFHPTVMAAEGEGAYEHMMRVALKSLARSSSPLRVPCRWRMTASAAWWRKPTTMK